MKHVTSLNSPSSRHSAKAMPNQSIELTANGLCPLAAAHVKR
jgi:hypothetical protein